MTPYCVAPSRRIKACGNSMLDNEPTDPKHPPETRTYYEDGVLVVVEGLEPDLECRMEAKERAFFKYEAELAPS